MSEAFCQFTGKLIGELDHCARAFCDQETSFSCESRTAYKNGIEAFDNILSHEVDLYFNNHIIRLTYLPHMPLSQSHSVLTGSISFEKANPDRIFHALSQVCGYLKNIPSCALTIPMILDTAS